MLLAENQISYVQFAQGVVCVKMTKIGLFFTKMFKNRRREFYHKRVYIHTDILCLCLPPF